MELKVIYSNVNMYALIKICLTLYILLPAYHSIGTYIILLYINDLPLVLFSNIHIDLYADDTEIYFSWIIEIICKMQAIFFSIGVKPVNLM